MGNLLSENKKMRNSSVRTFNWTLPAYQSRTGLKTCPLAGECAKGCYAQQGAYTWSTVYPKHEANLALTLDTQAFVEAMTKELSIKVKSAARGNYDLAIRIHDAGDYYNWQYILAWISIVRQFPGVTFYSYTKMVPTFKKIMATNVIPANLILIFSEGGLADELIDTRRDRHSRVFGSIEELREAGYVDATKDDSLAWSAVNHRIGLVYHGAKSRRWTTSAA